MLSRPKLSFCIYQNRKEKHCVDLVNILAMIDSDKLFQCPILCQMAGNFMVRNIL